MKRFTKALSMLLAIVMVVGLLPLSIIAEDIQTTHTVQFKLNYNGAHKIPSQKVADGECAVQPEDVTREGWIFEYWYVKTGDGIQKFDLSQPITEDVTLYACWDEDITYWGPIWSRNIIGAIESSKNDDNSDTEDGSHTVTFASNVANTANMPDPQEVNHGELLTKPNDPTKAGYIFKGWYTEDYMSLYDFKTAVTDDLIVCALFVFDNNDDDNDGASNGWEVENGYDPNQFDEEFLVTENYYDSNTTVSVKIKLTGTQLDTLEISPYTNPWLFNSTIPGYLCEPYDFSVDGSFDEATISFEFNEVYLEDPTFVPAIYYYNQETGFLEKLETTISGNKASAKVEHFSVYILLNSSEFDEVFDSDVRPPSADGKEILLDICFVIDISYSMEENDPMWIRKDILNKFIDNLSDKDNFSIVQFRRVAEEILPLTNDKNSAKNVIDALVNDDAQNDKSGTNATAGYGKALEILNNSSSNATEQYIIIISDGNDTYTAYDYDDLNSIAKENAVRVFTVSLGDDINPTHLKSVAQQTNGKYYHATLAYDLIEDFEKIEESIIPPEGFDKDSNYDGINDYYTKCLCDGTLRFPSGAATPFFGMDYDEIQSVYWDYDDDGLINGDELEVIETSYGTKCIMKSNPVEKDSDFDTFDDFIEVEENNTDPLTKNITTTFYDIYVADAINTYYSTSQGLYYVSNPGERAINVFDRFITGSNSNTHALYRRSLVEAMQTYIFAQDDVYHTYALDEAFLNYYSNSETLLETIYNWIQRVIDDSEAKIITTTGGFLDNSSKLMTFGLLSEKLETLKANMKFDKQQLKNLQNNSWKGQKRYYDAKEISKLTDNIKGYDAEIKNIQKTLEQYTYEVDGKVIKNISEKFDFSWFSKLELKLSPKCLNMLESAGVIIKKGSEFVGTVGTILDVADLALDVADIIYYYTKLDSEMWMYYDAYKLLEIISDVGDRGLAFDDNILEDVAEDLYSIYLQPAMKNHFAECESIYRAGEYVANEAIDAVVTSAGPAAWASKLIVTITATIADVGERAEKECELMCYASAANYLTEFLDENVLYCNSKYYEYEDEIKQYLEMVFQLHIMAENTAYQLDGDVVNGYYIAIGQYVPITAVLEKLKWNTDFYGYNVLFDYNEDALEIEGIY